MYIQIIKFDSWVPYARIRSFATYPMHNIYNIYKIYIKYIEQSPGHKIHIC